ncbi:hypothetical protein M407DRAFT_31917 [Tulasnella calospora MUT 4182]|uniref:DUF6535 domain-containing protein n=1 Tax=Tulasnella calospora MUT 4182 TaxID=1051891 RepID=A0A0C3KAI8_9AGAM|nr:hypothetical protein M407DRAFT_31917 [Tulasnella calospora MUT 4182]
MTTRLPETLKEMPDIPKEFGDDGGHFYRYYDELADEIDEDLVKSLKAQLDGILIFAGLFAGVNSAFLALTLPQMSPDPTDDTNALLLKIALGGNSSISSAADLPSASFIPPPRIYPINVLFSVSLTLALLSSFLAVLGQQWIVYYRKRGGGGPEHQRWEQFRRYLGAKRWRLELVLDDVVPSLLQLGLVVFCIAFALYLGTLSQPLNRIIASLLLVAAATILAMSTCAAFDPWCPFKMPLSRIVRKVASATAAVVVWLGMCVVTMALFLTMSIIEAISKAIAFCHSLHVAEPQHRDTIPIQNVGKLVVQSITGLAKIYRWTRSVGTRSAEEPDDLKIKALQRVMCTSEDRNALIHSAINLQVIRDERALSFLAKDEEFLVRLYNLHRATSDDSRRGQTGSLNAFVESRVFTTTFFHLLITVGSVSDIRYSELGICSSEIIALDNLSISPEEILCDLRAIPFTTSWLEGSTDFDVAFEGAAAALTRVEDLRLGSVVASVMLSSKEWYDTELSGYATWPRSKLLEELFSAYRLTSESEMFQTISRALTTMSAEWIRKPNHEIYVRLFELCLLPGREGISAEVQDAVLEHFDDHLLSVELRIRDKNASETDRQQGRDYQNRYVQSVADCFRAYNGKWSPIGASLQRYLDSVTKLIEADPEHSENPGTVVVLRRMRSSFPEPTISELLSFAMRSNTIPKPLEAYSKFGRLVDHIEAIWERKVYQDLGLRYQRLCCIPKRGEMWCNQQGPAMHMLAL